MSTRRIANTKIQNENSSKEMLILHYSNLKGKYLQQRNLADALIEPIIGCPDKRNHLKFAKQTVKYKPSALFKGKFFGSPKLYDFMWNNMDQTCYLHTSAYHVSWEWLTPPDEQGFGAFNLGMQEVPGPSENPTGLHAAWASWDDPRPYVDCPLQHEFAMLMRFWSYHADSKQFELAPMGLLAQWDATSDGTTDLYRLILTLDPAQQKQYSKLEVGDMSPQTPHLWEEFSSRTMAAVNLARRKGFDEHSYDPIWKVSRSKTVRINKDPGCLKIFSEAELDKMDISQIEIAYDALWQKYLGAKMLADYTLRFSVRNTDELSPTCIKLYKGIFVPKY
jgi:hypothetical protein